MLGLAYKPFMQSVTYAQCHNKPFMLSVVMLIVIILSGMTLLLKLKIVIFLHKCQMCAVLFGIDLE